MHSHWYEDSGKNKKKCGKKCQRFLKRILYKTHGYPWKHSFTKYTTIDQIDFYKKFLRKSIIIPQKSP